MRLFRPCFIAGWLYPEAVFRIRTEEKLLCLTFDDGPDPESTPRLLEVLDIFGIKAMFFCNGREAEEYPGLVQLIVSRGHVIGNHGYMHKEGWKTSSEEYLNDIALASRFTSDVLFRPPFGRMRPGQYRKLKKEYRIFLWDIMPYDFDRSFGLERSLKILEKMIRPGSIIVLHDTPFSQADKIVSEFLKYSLNKGYRFVLPAKD